MTSCDGRSPQDTLSRFRRLDLVEDALADAVETAARRWPRDGTPDNPAGWLHTTARRRVLDRLRAEVMAQRRLTLIATDLDRGASAGGRERADPGDLVEDDLLRLVLMCTHPALAPEAACALEPWPSRRPTGRTRDWPLEGIDMATSHRPMVVRAELLARTGATGEALVVLEEALRHCRNDAERLHLEKRRAELAAPQIKKTPG